MKVPSALLSLAMCVLAAPTPALAQYPAKPVRLIVPFAAGGATDSAARTVGQALARSLGQPVLVENKPGAEGAIAGQAVAGAPADGYTLLFGAISMLALPFTMKPAPFDALADFAPVTTVGRLTFGMYVNPGVPSRSMAEFVAYARANPGKLNYASSTVSEQLAASQFMKAAGADMVKVPYKGGVAAMPDLVTGRVQVYFSPLSTGIGQVKDGRLRMLAVMLPRRSALLPDVPTMEEVGLPSVSVPTYQVILAPMKTPRDIVERLSKEVNLVLQDPQVRTELEKQGLMIEGSTPQALGATMKETTQAWAKFVRDNDLAPL
jgi:tripartite-type tricarboxylate transporter receptor subunit TctC